MKLVIEIEDGNEALEEETEFCRILLEEVAENVSWRVHAFRELLERRGKLDCKSESETVQVPLRDINGNTVGFFKLEES